MPARSRTPLVLVTMVVALVTAACSGDDAEAPAETEADGPLRFALTAGDDEPGSLVVRATLSNGSDESVVVVRPFVTPHFVLLQMTGPDGREIPFDGPYPRLEPLSEGDVVALGPGESVSSQFDLTDHFAVPAGSVTVSAEYRARSSQVGDLALIVDPNGPIVAEPIVIEVGP